ncbi:hypothetical protein N7457_003242 [Penicillium paradoxum]|uniref:uncharacterized protein n=1 Tax=Penicillium paradoxum TaxID=176176 RepID=UPI002547EC02|nr:uncharacterized protein N7457_003242 [Penicillium paradoxum]KAJ5788252.1 hypothetical protein N7457_003242 [Penicillium paradoxum]
MAENAVTELNWQNHLPRILAVQTVLTVLALTAVALRLYVRIKLINNTAADDWTMLIAALCTLAGWILWIFRGVHGLGHTDAWFAAGNGDSTKVAQGSFWQVIIDSALGMAMLKVSIALNLLRLSPARWYVWCLWASIDLFVTFGLVNTGFNIFTDVLFSSIPIPIIWTLKMAPKVRLYLIGILSLGYVAVIFGVVKSVYQIAYAASKDTYLNDWILFWALTQFNTGILAACIPSLKPLASKILSLSEYASSTRARGRFGSRYDSRMRSLRTKTAKGTSVPTTTGNSNHIWSIHRGDQYALQELGSRESINDREDEFASDCDITTTRHKKWFSTDNSRQMQECEEKDGIVKTTEVIVT